MRANPSPARDALDLMWLRGDLADADYVVRSQVLDAAEDEFREAMKWRNRLRTVWMGFLLGLASPLVWLRRKRIEWKLRFRFWRAKRRVANGKWL